MGKFNKETKSSRRSFIKSSAMTTSAASIGSLAFSPSVFAGGDDIIRVGLIGCGGRGTGAASQALAAESRVKLTAMGDVFEDRLQTSLKSLKSIEGMEHKVDVPIDTNEPGATSDGTVSVENLEADIISELPNTLVTTHVEPLEDERSWADQTEGQYRWR